MTRPSCILGITAFALATMSAISGRVRTTNVTYYYTISGSSTCNAVSLSAMVLCTIGGTGCYYATANSLYQLYAAKVEDVCSEPLMPK